MAKPGRKPGVWYGPSRGSFSEKLAQLSVGEVLLLEGPDLEEVKKQQRRASSHCRFPVPMRDHRYTTNIYTAVRTSDPSDVRYMIRIERIE